MTTSTSTTPVDSRDEVFAMFAGSRWDLCPTFAHLREHDPVLHLPELDLWLVSRYDDVLTVIRDVKRFGHMPADMMSDVPAEVQAELPDGYAAWFPTLINTDPPFHTRIRKLAQKPLTARVIAAQEDMIRGVGDGLIDRFIRDGRTDLVANFAFPLPAMVLSNILGVPQEDRERFKTWALGVVELFNPAISAQRRLELARDQVEFNRYVEQAVRTRRANPGDDLISGLIQSQEDGEKSLTDKEILGVVAQLITAGFETAQVTILFTLALLCEHPETFARVRADLDLLPDAIEETLRRMTPPRGVVREAKCDVELSGVRIPEGARVYAMVGSANMDPDRFSCPAHFDIDRDATEMRGSLAFGQGAHKCIGMFLGRLETRVALELLIKRLPNVRIVPDERRAMQPGLIFHAPVQMEVEWDVPAAM